MFTVRHRTFLVAVAVAAAAALARPAAAVSGYYGASCAACHGAAPNTCNGCHEHGARNLSGSISKTSFAPGETMTFTVNAGSRSGWWRAAVLDASNQPVGEASVASGTSATLDVPAPSAAGTYAYRVAWYGNERGGGSGTGWVPDAGNAGHGYRAAEVSPVTVVAPAVPSPPPPAAPPADPGAGGESSGGGGCSSAGGSGLAALAGLALLWRRRQRGA